MASKDISEDEDQDEKDFFVTDTIYGLYLERALNNAPSGYDFVSIIGDGPYRIVYRRIRER